MPSWLLGLGKGLAWGLIGAGVKHYFLRRALRKTKVETHEKTEKIILNCYYVRYVVNLIVLVGAYFLFAADTLSLIGAALGLTIPKYFLSFLKLD